MCIEDTWDWVMNIVSHGQGRHISYGLESVLAVATAYA